MLANSMPGRAQAIAGEEGEEGTQARLHLELFRKSVGDELEVRSSSARSTGNVGDVACLRVACLLVACG